MERAGEAMGTTALAECEACATMGADVLQRADFVATAAHDDHRAFESRQLLDHVIARFGDLAFAQRLQPAPLEDSFDFLFKERRLAVRRGRDRASTELRIFGDYAV